MELKTFVVHLVGKDFVQVKAEQLDVLPAARIIVLRAGGDAVAAFPVEQVRSVLDAASVAQGG